MVPTTTYDNNSLNNSNPSLTNMAAPKLSEDPSSTHLVPDGSEFAESQPLESSKFDQKASRALIRKVDLVLLPFLSLLYLYVCSLKSLWHKH